MNCSNKKFFTDEFKCRAVEAGQTGLVFAIAIAPILLVSALISRASR